MLKSFLPRKRVDTIYEIDLDALWASGVRGIITDLDNTLVGAREPLATPKLGEWLKKVNALGFKVLVVSNNNAERVSKFADPLNIPYIAHARKPLRKGFLRALAQLGLAPHETVVIGDQLLTDVFGANRNGLNTVLVTPIAPQDESVFTRFNRRVERYIFSQLKKRGLLTWDN